MLLSSLIFEEKKSLASIFYHFSKMCNMYCVSLLLSNIEQKNYPNLFHTCEQEDNVLDLGKNKSMGVYSFIHRSEYSADNLYS